MEQLTSFMLGVWREASRHIEITEFTATLTAMLTPHLPIDRLVIRRMNQERTRLETLAVEPLLDGESLRSDATQWSTADMDRLLRWCRRGELIHQKLQHPTRHIAFDVIPTWLQGEIFLG